MSIIHEKIHDDAARQAAEHHMSRVRDIARKAVDGGASPQVAVTVAEENNDRLARSRGRYVTDKNRAKVSGGAKKTGKGKIRAEAAISRAHRDCAKLAQLRADYEANCPGGTIWRTCKSRAMKRACKSRARACAKMAQSEFGVTF